MEFQKPASDWPGPKYFRAGAWANAVSIVLAQLHDLVIMNAPLSDGLISMAADAPTTKLRCVFLALHDDVSRGKTIGESMTRLHRFFPPSITEVVCAAENANALPAALMDLQDTLLEKNSIRFSIWSHFMYVGMLLTVTTLMFAFTRNFVVMQIYIIHDLFRHKPAILMNFIDIPGEAWMILAVCVFATLLLVWRNMPLLSERTGRLNTALRRVFGALPFIGRVMKLRDAAQVASVLALSFQAGKTATETLLRAANLSIGPEMRGALKRAADSVDKGTSPVAALLSERESFPDSFSGWLALSSDEATLGENLRQAVRSMQDEAVRRATLVMEVGAPLAVCMIGLLIFFWYAAMFLPISQLSLIVSGR